MNIKERIRYMLVGFGMGMADLVPGVSGGTIAFIFGIYQKLIESIKTVTGKSLQLFFQGKFKESIASVPFGFLIPLAIGLFAAVLLLSKLLTFLLEEYPEFIWSFFFGLVLISIFVVGKRIQVWTIKTISSFIIAAVAAFFIVGAIPFETPANPFMFFISGMIAISAMILPGISGSFILLLLGKYEQILTAVNERDIVTLGIFMVGCVVGIALFSRFLSWLFHHYHDVTIAALAGFLLGSLRRIWPWKEVITTRINSKGKIEPLITENILPLVNAELFISLALMAAGIALIQYLERYNTNKSLSTSSSHEQGERTKGEK